MSEQNSHSAPPADEGSLAKLDELIRETRIGMLTTVSTDGALVSRPMATQDVDFDGSVFFITQADTDVAREADGQRVNVSFASSGSWVSLTGTGHIVRDEQRLEQLWNMWVDAWTDGGPENPQNVILQVEGDTARYWDSLSAPVHLFGVLRAKLTGERPSGGDASTVEL